MKSSKKCSPCVNSFLKSNSSSRSYKNGRLISGYDTTYDSDDDTLDIKTYGDMSSIPNDLFIKNILHNRHKSLMEKLVDDFSVSLTPDHLYNAKKIGIDIAPIISSKYHPILNDTSSKKKDSKKKKNKKGKKSRKQKK
jgi:hypothetical protein